MQCKIDRDNAPNQQAKQIGLSVEALSAPIVAKVSIAETNALHARDAICHKCKKIGHYSFQCYGKSVAGIPACNDTTNDHTDQDVAFLNTIRYNSKLILVFRCPTWPKNRSLQARYWS